MLRSCYLGRNGNFVIVTAFYRLNVSYIVGYHSNGTPTASKTFPFRSLSP